MANTPPTETSSLLSRLEGAAAYHLTVSKRHDVSPSLVSITLTGDLQGLVVSPGNDLMLAVPVVGGDGSFRRRYTIRRADVDSGEVELWIDRTSGGPGATWAESAPIGSSIEAIGPRGKVTLDEMADWHLFLGDLSFLPASYAMAEAIEPPGQALFIVEIDQPGDAIVPSMDPRVTVTVGFIERDGRALNDPAGLLAGLAALEIPPEEGHVYVGGELTVVAALKAALIERGLEKQAIDAKPYWRAGVANLAHGEPKKDDA